MRYLAKYRLFLEEIEGENLGGIPVFDPKPAEWIEKAAEEEKEVSGETKETQSSSESTESADKNNQPDKDKGSESTKSDEGLEGCIAQIISDIQKAYNEESPSYFFRPYAVSAWTSIFTFLILHDKEGKAVKDFFGDGIIDKKSWWFGHVTSELSKHISINKDGKKLSLVEALEKGQKLESIKTTVLAETEDEDKKNLIEVAFEILMIVWPELRKATLSGDNRYSWLHSTRKTTYEIDVNADFGVGYKPSSVKEYISKDKQDWYTKIRKAADDVEKLPPSKIFEILKTIVLFIDGLFQDGSKNVWISYKSRLNDDDTGAATWLEAQRNYMKKHIFEPLKTKVDGYNYANPLAKEYYKKQIDRIDRELLGKIIEKMRGNFDLYDTVEFRLQDLSKKYKIDVEVDTDF
jgi:hypothetical protein